MPDQANIILSHYQTRPLLNNDSEVLPLSPDLGRSMTQAKKTTKGWLLPDGQVLKVCQIEEITAEENSCFIFRENNLVKIEAFSEFTNRYYSLMPTSKAPTMLISGIPMHRIKDITPIEDTTRKLQAAGRPGGRILDTAMGLGYTAIQAAQSAESVITIEFDPAVLSICRLNPWSKELFTNPRITKIIGDTWDLADFFPNGYFNVILHDPPTFNLAGHLYSQTMYETFHRILKSKGRMFHYIGNPDSKSGASVTRGVVKRLQQVGFSVTLKPNAFGLLAKK